MTPPEHTPALPGLCTGITASFRTVISTITLLAAPLVAFPQSGIRPGEFTNAEWQVIRDAYPQYAAIIDNWRPLTHPRQDGINFLPSGLGNTALAAMGFLDVTAAPFNADKTGATDVTEKLRDAIRLARDYNLVVWMPAGTYRISDTLELRQQPYLLVNASGSSIQTGGDKYFCAVFGPRDSGGNRAKIVLANNSVGFNSTSAPKPIISITNNTEPGGSAADPHLAHETSDTKHYNQMWVGVDIQVGSGNAGAVGIWHRGAEGSTIQDITIDLTASGHTGIWSPPGSGGSVHKVKIIGGRVGIDTRMMSDLSKVGTQPSPNFSQLHLINQSELALTVLCRGALIVAGFRIETQRNGPVIFLRNHWDGEPFDSSLGLVDGEIIYATSNANNTIIDNSSTNSERDRSYFFSNVYTQRAAKSDTLKQVPANQSGWTHFRMLAVSVTPLPKWNRNFYERIYIDGAQLGGDVFEDSVAGAAPTTDFLELHGWGDSFPSVGTPGMVSILDYGANSTSADNTAAIQAAINASDLVLVPKGRFKVKNTLDLRANTKFIGIHPMLSVIEGVDTNAERFGGANPPPTGRPILRTDTSSTGRPIVAFLNIAAPDALAQHSAADVACYPVEWRAGKDAVWNMVRMNSYSVGNWSVDQVLRLSLGVRDIGSPYSDPIGVTFATTNNNNTILHETLAGSARLLTKGESAFIANTAPNMTMTRTGGGTFSLTSLKVGKAGFDPAEACTVSIQGTLSGGGTVTSSVNVPGGTDRTGLVAKALNWTNVTSVKLTSTLPFSVDDVETNLGTATFNNVAATNINVYEIDKRDGFLRYPFSSFVHPQLKITGGGKFYNLWYHGDVWGQRDYRQILVTNNTAPVRIYHWHLQHIRSDAQAEFRNASFVNVYGIKHEYQSRFVDIINSDDIRIFGSGGLGDPARGQAEFRFVNTPNYLASNLADEINPDAVNFNAHKDSHSNPLVVNDPASYDIIWDVLNGVTTKPATLDRPILWLQGAPEAGYLESGSGLPAGVIVSDIGTAPASTAAFSTASGRYDIDAGGADIWGTADSFTFVQQSSSGDCAIEGRMVSTSSTNLNAKLGVMIRESTAAESMQASVMYSPNGSIKFYVRTATGGTTTVVQQVSGVSLPCYVRLVRTGNTFSAFYKVSAGASWTPLGTRDVAMAASSRIGQAFCSKTNATLKAFASDNIVTQP